MAHRRIIAALAAAVVLASCGSDDTARRAPDRTTGTNRAGRHDLQVTVDGLPREFIVYVPDRLSGDVAAPAVFVVHGTGGDGEAFFESSGWLGLAEAEGLITVYPSALTYCFFEDDNRDGDTDDQGEGRTATKWDITVLTDFFAPCADDQISALDERRRRLVDHPLADDVHFFDAMLDVLHHEYAIDERRIYATGFSSGAQMTGHLAIERGDRFAAIAMSGSGIPFDPDGAGRPLPLLFSLGERDNRFTQYNSGKPLPLDPSLFDLSAFAMIRDRALTVTHLTSEYELVDDRWGSRSVVRFGSFSPPVLTRRRRSFSSY